MTRSFSSVRPTIICGRVSSKLFAGEVRRTTRTACRKPVFSVSAARCAAVATGRPARIGIGNTEVARDRRRRRAGNRGLRRGAVRLHGGHRIGHEVFDALDLHRARVVDLLDTFGLQIQLVVADLDLVGDPQRHALGDPARLLTRMPL